MKLPKYLALKLFAVIALTCVTVGIYLALLHRVATMYTPEPIYPITSLCPYDVRPVFHFRCSASTVWKTYTDTQNNFSIQYPSDWTITTNTDVSQDYIATFSDPNSDGPVADDMYISKGCSITSGFNRWATDHAWMPWGEGWRKISFVKSFSIDAFNSQDMQIEDDMIGSFI